MCVATAFTLFVTVCDGIVHARPIEKKTCSYAQNRHVRWGSTSGLDYKMSFDLARCGKLHETSKQGRGRNQRHHVYPPDRAFSYVQRFGLAIELKYSKLITFYVCAVYPRHLCQRSNRSMENVHHYQDITHFVY